MAVTEPEDFISTGTLPAPARIQALLDDAFQRFRGGTAGEVSGVYPALARMPPDLFGLSVVSVGGNVYSVGDA
jgi:glutaminase